MTCLLHKSGNKSTKYQYLGTNSQTVVHFEKPVPFLPDFSKLHGGNANVNKQLLKH